MDAFWIDFSPRARNQVWAADSKNTLLQELNAIPNIEVPPDGVHRVRKAELDDPRIPRLEHGLTLRDLMATAPTRQAVLEHGFARLFHLADRDYPEIDQLRMETERARYERALNALARLCFTDPLVGCALGLTPERKNWGTEDFDREEFNLPDWQWAVGERFTPAPYRFAWTAEVPAGPPRLFLIDDRLRPRSPLAGLPATAWEGPFRAWWVVYPGRRRTERQEAWAAVDASHLVRYLNFTYPFHHTESNVLAVSDDELDDPTLLPGEGDTLRELLDTATEPMRLFELYFPKRHPTGASLP